jgi:hypothetical protein
MAAPGLANAVGVAGFAIPEQHLLGWQAMYSLPDEERSGARVMRVWANNGLDVADLPDARSPVHVFQSACASVRQIVRNPNGQKVEIRADEIENNGACRYQITLKTWDLANKSIEHEKAMRVDFDKANGTLSVDYLGHQDPHLLELEDRIRKHFDANAKTVPGKVIRNAIRKKLESLGGQNLRGKAGGVYFVPTNATIRQGSLTAEVRTRPILDGMTGVLNDLYGERGDFWILQLANDEGAQEMVRKRFTINVNDELRDLTEETINRVRSGKGRGVREERIMNLVQKRRRIGAAVQQFEQLVAVERGDISANLRDLDKAIADLQALADS